MNMNTNKNLYQLSKTLRFGLTLKDKKSKNGRMIYQSHSQFKELVALSEQRVKETITTSSKRDVDSLIRKMGDCLNCIKELFRDWRLIFSHQSNIELDKDYYKRLTKKIGFEGFWYKENKFRGTKTKQPQARNIPMAELKHKVGNSGKECAAYVVDYWKDLLISAETKLRESHEQQKKFSFALSQKRTDNKPNEVELKKSFLALVAITKELLYPLMNSQILFAKLDRLNTSNENDRDFLDFQSDYKGKRALLGSIEEITAYFNENGSNVNYCRATLNPMTALKQKTNDFQSKIVSDLRKLKVDTILGKYETVDSFMENRIKSISAKEKIARINDFRSYSLIYRSVLFKYKSIPANVRRDIAQLMSKELNKSEDDIYEFLSEFGTPRTPQKDYADMKDKSEFNLDTYPLKVAFDFAWEGLARSIYHPTSDFPLDACKKFLQLNFNVDINKEELRLYAELLELNALLSTLDKSAPTDREEIVGKAQELNDSINWEKFDDKNSRYYKDEIAFRLGMAKGNEKYEKVKKQISMNRGRLKNRITIYDDLTSQYKRIAMDLGKIYAAIRENIMDANELTKVSHYAMIVEDSNCDKYLLLQEVKDNLSNKISNQASREFSDLKVYYVNSITSSAIAKMVKKSMNESEINELSRKSDEEREKIHIGRWKALIKSKRYDQQFNLNLSGNNFETLKKEIDSKCYILEKRYLSNQNLRQLVEQCGCLLFPIVNQDFGKEIKTESNQFTKDWNAIFSTGKNPWRLTPEFRISYRQPVPDYPTGITGSKRYSRFQMNAQFLCDFIPLSDSYISYREQIDLFKDNNMQKAAVCEFNNSVSPAKPAEKKSFYVIGIDRGQVELATLCVVDQDKKIIGGFDIYTRKFNPEKKQWEHYLLGKRDILDLSNLRVETTISIDGNPEKAQVLVDLSEVLVKDKEGNYTKPNKLQVKMQQMAYIRKLQFQMQTNPERVLEWYEGNSTEDAIIKNIVDKQNGERGLISFYGAAVVELEDTLPVRKIKEMLEEFKALKGKEKSGASVKKELDELTQLDPVDNLKAGVVANMVGVIAYLLKKFNYNAYISLEDLSQPFKTAAGGVSGILGKYDANEGRRQDVEKYAGLGLYNFFEMQLLRKLFKIQTDSGNILHLVPAFRAQKNYDNVAVGSDKVKNQFGIVFFVDANGTSITCPHCGANNAENFKPQLHLYPEAKKGKIHGSNDKKEGWVDRDKNNNDRIHCYCCGFDTLSSYTENPLKYIKSGDDNAAFIISVQGVKAYELATTVLNNK